MNMNKRNTKGRNDRKKKHKNKLPGVLAGMLVVSLLAVRDIGWDSLKQSADRTSGSNSGKLFGTTGEAVQDSTEKAGVETDGTAIPAEAQEEAVCVSFLDVGQGDSILVTSDEGCILIDTGASSALEALMSELSGFGVERLQYLILTHPDADHIGNASYLLEYFPVETVLMPDCTSDSKTYEQLAETLSEHTEVKVQNPSAGDVYDSGDIKIEVIGPVYEYSDTNANSLVTKISYGNISYLLMGDATGEETDDILEAGFDLNADVYKCAHHGSANDGCNDEYFLSLVNPEYAVISCGLYNSYGHPHIETMELLLDYGICTFRTDLQGTVTSYTDGNTIRWTTEPTNNYTNGNNIGR